MSPNREGPKETGMEKGKRHDELLGRFRELAQEVDRVHDAWKEAAERDDLAAETRLIAKETQLLAEIDQLVKEFQKRVHPFD